MQIRLSWKFLGALLIFVAALAILGRFLLSLAAPVATAPVATAASAAPTAAASRTAEGAAPAPTEAPATSPSPLATTPGVPATGATTAASDTPAAAPSATPAPTATPTSTAEPTATASATPAPSPTPRPADVAVVNQGFGQSDDELGYAFIVSNPNPELIARDVPFQVVVYDSAGIVLRTDTGNIPIVEGLAEARTARIIQLASGLQAARVEVLLGGGQFVRSIPQPQIGFENVAFVPGDPARITGLVRNPLGTPLQGLPAVGIAYDANGRIIGGGDVKVPFIAAGGQAAADVIVVVSGDVALVELAARPDTLLAP